MKWLTIQWETEDRAYKYEAHAFKPMGKKFPWECCRKCGLIALRNEPTRRAIKKGCNWDISPA